MRSYRGLLPALALVCLCSPVAYGTQSGPSSEISPASIDGALSDLLVSLQQLRIRLAERSIELKEAKRQLETLQIELTEARKSLEISLEHLSASRQEIERLTESLTRSRETLDESQRLFEAYQTEAERQIRRARWTAVGAGALATLLTILHIFR